MRARSGWRRYSSLMGVWICRTSMAYMGLSPVGLEVFERPALPFHPEAQVGHENEIGMGSARHQGLAVAGQQGRLIVRIQPELGRRHAGVGHEAGTERVIGLQPVEASVQPVGRGGWEAVVERLAHSRHSTIALPWCQEG